MEHKSSLYTPLTLSLLAWAETQEVDVVVVKEDWLKKARYLFNYQRVEVSWNFLCGETEKFYSNKISPYQLMEVVLSHELGHHIAGADEASAWNAGERLIQELGHPLPKFLPYARRKALRSYGIKQ